MTTQMESGFTGSMSCGNDDTVVDSDEFSLSFVPGAPFAPWRDALAIGLYTHGLLLLVPLVGSNPIKLLAWECLLGIGVAAGGMVVLHDAIHERFSETQRWINILVVHSVLPIGLWVDRRTRQHVPVHHGYTGVYPIDEFTDTSWMLRTHPAAPWRKIHKYQHLYVWIAYAMMWPIDQTSQLRAVSWRDDGFGYRTRGCRIAACLIEHLLSLAVLSPYAVLVGPQRLIFLLMPALLLGGFITATVLVVGHISEGLCLPVVDSPVGTPLQQACTTTVSFSVHSSLVAWMTGGLSRHLAHHVFPSAPRTELGRLNEALVAIARRDLGIDPVVYATFPEAVRGHYRRLRVLGLPPEGTPGPLAATTQIVSSRALVVPQDQRR